MTDEELIARLREDVFYGDERLHNLSRHNPLHMEAADRIEALVKELATSNEVGRAFEEDAGQQRARAERLEAALKWQAEQPEAHPFMVAHALAALKGDDHE